MTVETLLIELITEELPPASLVKLSKSFADEILKKLTTDLLTTSNSKMRVYATPRRIGFQVTKIKRKAENSIREIKLLPKKMGIDDSGLPTELLKKKIYSLVTSSKNSINFDFDDEKLDYLDKNFSNFILKNTIFKTVGKQESVYIKIDEVGVDLSESLQSAVLLSIKRLPIPKMMTYQNFNKSNTFDDVKFIRPAHKLVALHGETVLKIKALGLESSQFSDGHRFLGKKDLKIDSAESYEKKIQEFGKIIPNFDNRKKRILDELTKKSNLKDLVMTEDLLNEITALCEWPVIYEGFFDKEFLSIPYECLTLTMQKNQKFIPLKTKKNELSNKFFLVSNIFTNDPRNIIHGNEKVLKARLSDAQFFFNLDRKKKLEEKVILLSKVIYHNQLGNIYDRTQRLILLTEKWGGLLGLEKQVCYRAALLSKADLTSKMVDEFPELQGVMGKYYAQFDNENTEVCIAIEEHYKPKFSGDHTPKNLLGSCLSLADRIESIVGLWSIGMFPSGEKDPMGLRRNAIAVLRILIENKINLNLNDLILDSAQTLNYEISSNARFKEIKSFFLERLKNWLKENGHESANIEAAIIKCNNKISELPKRLEAIKHFISFSASYDLCSANKRIKNILKKSSVDIISCVIDPNLFEEEAEIILFKKLNETAKNTKKLLEKNMYKEVLVALSELKHPVDNFFQTVLVNTENDVLKKNRLCLLRTLNETMNQVAELSLLVD